MMQLALFVTVLANFFIWLTFPFSHKMREYIPSTRVPSCLFVRNFVPAGGVATLKVSAAAFIQAPGVSGRGTGTSTLEVRGLKLAGV